MRRSPLWIAAVMLVGLGSPVAGSSVSRAARRPHVPVPAPSCSGSSAELYALTRGVTVISQTDVPVCVHGTVTVTFAGDPATGCATDGLCAYSGSETWDPDGPGDVGLLTVAHDGRRSTSATLSIGGLGAPVASTVQRATGSGPPSACTDRSRIGGGFFALPVAGGRVEIGLGHTQEPVFGTRCAGPLTVDTLGRLPRQTMSLARLRRGRLTIDLSGAEPFAAGGLSGTVDSTVMLTLGRPRVRPQQVPSGVPGHSIRLTTVRYRLTRFSGRATATVRTSAVAAACGPLDACGVQGTISVVPGTRSRDDVFLTASSRTRRSRRDLLTALGLATGGDSSGVSINGGGEIAGGGSVTAALTQDGDACADHVPLEQTELRLRRHAGRLVITAAPAKSQAADPLRSRCPGPALGDHPFTSASVPLSVLRRPRFTVRLHGTTFDSGPYHVTTHSTFTVTLRRGRVTTQVLPFAARTG